jgi:hypothetical protein
MERKQGNVCEQIADICEVRLRHVLTGAGVGYLGAKAALSDKTRQYFPKQWKKANDFNRRMTQKVFGGEKHSISYRTAIANKQNKLWGKVVGGAMNAVDPGHLERAIKHQNEIDRKLVARKKRRKKARA